MRKGKQHSTARPALRHLHPQVDRRGLDQAFNSLDAQREACAAYILSQRHEGWSLVPDYYDDGGGRGPGRDFSVERGSAQVRMAHQCLGSGIVPGQPTEGIKIKPRDFR